jgi:hypothetical protein
MPRVRGAFLPARRVWTGWPRLLLHLELAFGHTELTVR